MNNNRIFILATIITLLSVSIVIYAAQKSPIDDKVISYTADPQDIALYWKNDSNKVIGSIENLKTYIESKGQELIFAANGGMFDSEFSPQGLFIQDSKVVKPLDTSPGNGNFYLKPNGVFHITSDNKAAICKTEDFINNGQIKYATQSGPMLIADGKIHPAFKEGSHNIHIRNGVGILPDGKVLFAMSKIRVNFYDFANYFKEQGCLNALYLDGFVSRTYLPEENWIQTDGNFGVIIGVTRPASK